MTERSDTMTIFLTGERGVGKSTALRRALEGSALRIGGFRTDFGSSRYEENKTLRLLPWGAPQDSSAGETCARLGPGRRQVLPETFDSLGVRLLREAGTDPACQLIVMDELGFLEAEAAGFRRAVLSALSGPKPVLGVVRLGLGAWGNAPLGEVWTVTEENRDAIPARLRQRLAAIFPAAFQHLEEN